MLEELARCFMKLPDALSGHMMLAMAALLVGLAISLPLGIVASRRPKLAELVLGIAGVIQTVPSLALLALMVPLLLGTVGFLPAFLALTLYSILPALSNTIIGIRGVDPALVEAARGLGMNDRQMLVRVQLPLAAPVIIGGLRTATVLVVGTATLVTDVGGTSLGNYISAGLQLNNHVWTVFGCVLSAALAVTMDQLVRLFQLSAERRSYSLAWSGALGLLLVLVGGLAKPAVWLFGSHDNRVVVGSAGFTEQYILSDLLASELQSAGFAVKQRGGMGETILFEALFRNKIDCCVEYSGNIWATEMKRTDFVDRVTMLESITRFLDERYGVVCLGSLGFENAYALAMPEQKSEQLGIRSIGDLVRHAPQWEIAGDKQIFSRSEWVEVTTRYGLSFAREKSMDPALMYDAVGKGPLQVIVAYTSDGRIRANRLRLLEDPKQAFPPYDAVLLVSKQAALRPGLIDSLRPLVGAIELGTMQRANLRVDVEKQSYQRAAAELLHTISRRK